MQACSGRVRHGVRPRDCIVCRVRLCSSIVAHLIQYVRARSVCNTHRTANISGVDRASRLVEFESPSGHLTDIRLSSHLLIRYSDTPHSALWPLPLRGRTEHHRTFAGVPFLENGSVRERKSKRRRRRHYLAWLGLCLSISYITKTLIASLVIKCLSWPNVTQQTRDLYFNGTHTRTA